MKSYFNKPLFQGARGNRGDSCPKGAGSKASTATYRNPHLRVGVGLASKDSWPTKVNSWLKPREKKVAKSEMKRPAGARRRSRTKQAPVPGPCGGGSHASPERMAPGVKRGPTSPVPRSRQETPETLPPAAGLGEDRGEIGTKQTPGVTPGIGPLRTGPKGRPLPATPSWNGSEATCPW